MAVPTPPYYLVAFPAGVVVVDASNDGAIAPDSPMYDDFVAWLAAGNSPAVRPPE